MSGPARLGLAAVALVTCAFFALGIYQSRELASASAVLDSGRAPTAAQVRSADAHLADAATLNPDRTVAVDRAQLALAAGRPARARALLAPVLAAEPDDLQAWIVMVKASADDRTEREIAFANVLELEGVKG